MSWRATAEELSFTIFPDQVWICVQSMSCPLVLLVGNHRHSYQKACTNSTIINPSNIENRLLNNPIATTHPQRHQFVAEVIFTARHPDKLPNASCSWRGIKTSILGQVREDVAMSRINLHRPGFTKAIKSKSLCRKQQGNVDDFVRVGT